MKESEETIVRIGMVNYLNTAPIHEKWKNSVQHENWQLVEGTPATLNRHLADGKIDMGLVSSFEYGLHPDRYKILSGLSISANGPVGSVLLFSHVPMKQLDQEPVLFSAQSETSVSLLKIILEEFQEVQPHYSTGDVQTADGDEFKAVLAIGDDALKIAEKSTYLYEYDLADIWKRQTGLPFVFAVCAVREEFCQEQPQELAAIHRELIRCRDEGKNDLEAICEIAAPKFPMSKKKCHQYLSAIEYDLGGQKRKALETFFDFLIKRGDIDSRAIPLKIFANLH
ncbi:MAG: menaquinone biosynthesis protein [Desulforhopalus sp.]